MRCSRKLSFDTVEQAERTAAVVAGLRAGSPGVVPVRLYECACGRLHFTSKTEAEIAVAKASTVAQLEVAPLFQPQAPTAPANRPASDACAGCGGEGARFELRGAIYHRKCRTYALRALPVEEQRELLIAWARAGQAKADQRAAAARERNLARTGPAAKETA